MDRALRNYLTNMQVDVSIAKYTKCWDSWRDIDYVPHYNKFYYICDGEGWLKIDGKEYYPLPGQLYLMPAGVIQSYSSINQNTFEKYWCHFSARIGDKNLFDILSLPHYINVKDKTHIETIFVKLIDSYRGDEPASPLMVKSALLELIAYYINHSNMDKALVRDSHSNEKIRQILEYIENHIHHELTIDELAHRIHFHPSHLIRFFKKNIGTSPMKYIKKMRIEKAKMLLNTTELAITEIGCMVGFKNIFHFSKAFKKYVGYSPAEYRHVERGEQS